MKKYFGRFTFMRKEKLRVERTSKTPEFIPSLYQWIEPDKQRKRANELANMTKKDDGE